MESEKFRNALEVDLIYLCTFGLDDPVRENVNSAVHTIRHGHKDAVPDPES